MQAMEESKSAGSPQELTPMLGRESWAQPYTCSDEDVQYYINKLDTWTADFAEAFNARHKEGYRLDGEPGEDFFTFVSEDGSVFPAMHIRVNPDIEEDPGRIAAAYVESGQYEQGQVANGENALRLS